MATGSKDSLDLNFKIQEEFPVKNTPISSDDDDNESQEDTEYFVSMGFVDKNQFQLMEKLNLQLENTVLALEGVIIKKQRKIGRLANELEMERRLKGEMEEKLSKMTGSIVQLNSAIDTIIKNLKSDISSDPESCDDDEINDSPISYLNQLSSEVDKRFNEISDNNCSLQEELADMNSTLSSLQECLEVSSPEKPFDSEESTVSENHNSVENSSHFLDNKEQQLDAGTTSEANIEYHGMDHSKNNTRSSCHCVCGQRFGSKQNLGQHVKYHTLERKFSCEMCLQKFISPYYLRKHLESVHNVRLDKASRSLLGCRKCGEMFATKWDLCHHQRISHTSGGEEVGNRVKSRTEDNNENNGVFINGSDGRFHAKDDSKKHLGFFCICGAKYRHRSSLLSHIQFLTNEWKFSCKTCGQRFYGANELRRHMIHVHKYRPGKYCPSFGCRRCGKLFRSFGLLVKHRRVDHRRTPKGQTTVKSSKPVVLSQDSSSPPKLTPHFVDELLTTGEVDGDGQHHDFAVPLDPYTDPTRFHCSCSRHFATRKQLSDHIRAKLKGNIFKCSLCPASFEFHVNLKLHVRKTHKVQYQQGRFGCKECGSTFQLYQELMTHRLQNHYTYNSKR